MNLKLVANSLIKKSSVPCFFHSHRRLDISGVAWNCPVGVVTINRYLSLMAIVQQYWTCFCSQTITKCYKMIHFVIVGCLSFAHLAANFYIMAEIRQEFKFEDKGMLDGMRAMRDLAVAIEKGFDEAADGAGKFSKEVQEDMTNSRKALDKVIDGLDKKAKATEKDEKATKAWKDEVKNAAGEVNILGVNLGGAIDKLKEKKKSLDNVVKGLGATGTASKRLGTIIKTTLISTGFGALIVVLGSLITYLTRTQRGMDKLNVAFKAIGSVIDNVIDRIANVGEGFVSIISGDFRKGFNEIKTSFAGIGEEIRKDIKAATDLEKRQQELIKVQRALTVEEAKRRTEIEKLREESRKQGISEDEAIAKLEKAGRLEDELAAKRTAAAREEYEIIKERNELADSKNADLDAEAEALARLEAIEGERARNNRRLLSELQSLRNKSAAENAAAAKAREEQLAAEAERVKAVQDAYINLVGTIEDKLAAQELDKLSGRERLKAEQDLALQEIDLLEQKAKAAALAAGQEYTLANQFLQIRENIIESFKEEARELAQVETQVERLGGAIDRSADAIFEKLGRQITPFGLDPGEAESAGEKNVQAIAQGMRKGAEENKNLFDEIRIEIMSWLGLSGEEMHEVEEAAAMTFQALGGLYSESINRQIDENARLIDSIKDQEAILREGLERELRLQEEGRANNVEGKRKELEQIRKEEEKARKEAEKLRRRQNAIEIADNLVKQGSNLATAVTEIFAANAGIPIVGIIQAGLAITAMFSAFNRAKSQAQAVISQRAFEGGPLEDYLGGKRRSGFVKRGGQSDKPGRGNGYRVQGTDLVIGGDEFLMNEDESRIHDKFLTAMNKGAFRNVDLNSLVENQAVPLSEMSKYNRLTSIRRASIERSDRTRRDGILTDAVNRGFRELIGLQKRRKERMPLSDFENGYVEFDDQGNKRIIRK